MGSNPGYLLKKILLYCNKVPKIFQAYLLEYCFIFSIWYHLESLDSPVCTPKALSFVSVVFWIRYYIVPSPSTSLPQHMAVIQQRILTIENVSYIEAKTTKSVIMYLCIYVLYDLLQTTIHRSKGRFRQILLFVFVQREFFVCLFVCLF